MKLYCALTGLRSRDVMVLLAEGRFDLLAKNAARHSVLNAYTILRTVDWSPRAAWYEARRLSAID